jgi:hypothetical protein
MAPSIVESITMWMNAKQKFANEQRVPGSEKITALNLSVYLASHVTLSTDKTHYFLVGDSAFGVPFFR